MADMTRLLEQAIADLRQLPEYEQDLIADVIFAYLSNDEREYHQSDDPVLSGSTKPPTAN
jgi:hypothetical protein